MGSFITQEKSDIFNKLPTDFRIPLVHGIGSYLYQYSQTNNISRLKCMYISTVTDLVAFYEIKSKNPNSNREC